MRPDVPQGLLDRAGEWDELHRWERSELGGSLRRLGLAYGEIRELIPVQKGTLSYWCRYPRLSPEQIAAIEWRSSPSSRREIPVDTQGRRRIELTQIRAEARALAQRRLDESFFVAGFALYWGEGSKTRNSCSLTNTDPAVLRTFAAWVRAYLDADAQFVLSLHLHEGNNDESAQAYWRSQTGLLESPVTKTNIRAARTGHRMSNLPHGICRVRVRNPSDHWNRVIVWIDAVASHFGPLPMTA
jgi:hypothetical protein